MSTEQRDKAAKDYATVNYALDYDWDFSAGWDAHAATMPDEKALIELLKSPQHAPRETHDIYTGGCIACPVPLHELSPHEIAEAVLALLNKEGED